MEITFKFCLKRDKEKLIQFFCEITILLPATGCLCLVFHYLQPVFTNRIIRVSIQIVMEQLKTSSA
jgi:hypothetical protein